MATLYWSLLFLCFAAITYLIQKNWQSIVKWFRGIFKKQVHAVNSFTFIQVEGNMEKYKGTWTSSPSSFVEKHNLVYQFAGAGEVVGPDLPSSAIDTTVTFADGDLGKSGFAWVRTTGDNATVGNSSKVAFTVSNAASVQPVENFGFAWAEHTV